MGSNTEAVVVTGIGLSCAWGERAEDFYRALRDGEPGFAPLTGFEQPELRVPVAGQIDFNPRQRFRGRNVRPVDRTGRLAIMAAEGALSTGGRSVDGSGDDGDLVGLSLATLFGSIKTISEFDRRGLEAGPKYVKPLDFANSVINAAAGQTAIWFGLRGTNATVAGGAPASLQAIGQSRDLLRQGRAQAMLCGGAEELCFESLYGFQQAGLLALESPSRPRPWDRQADGMVLAEGSALLLLETAAEAARRDVPARATVLGHGSAFDPSRGREIDSASRAVELAVKAALKDAELNADRIDLVVASAGGRIVADRAEALGLTRALSNAAGGVPVTSIQGQMGRPLGATGAFQALAMLGALETGEVPGILGLDKPDPAVTHLDLCLKPREMTVNHGLITCLGLDGAAAALVLGRAG